MAKAIFASEALLPGGWAQNVRVVLDGNHITSVSSGAAPQVSDTRVESLIPGLSNLHSHAFQRAMAGLAETRGPSGDNFWTWRETMYRFALRLNPDQMQSVAEMAYVEMLEAGFTRVGEFHYLHHDRDGHPFADPAEMSLRILAAATLTGINLTHLPVFYAHSDFGAKSASAGQRRFTHDVDRFCMLTNRMRSALSRPLDRLGIAPHSLRAATEDELINLVAAHPTGPVHIHVAEQIREVEDSIAFSGRRPVDTLLDRVGLNERWCLIHATHMSEAECLGLAATGAVAGLCPVTEANLGDGLFPAVAFLAAGGRFGIGTDSNVEITAAGEMRLLEYGQRLFHRQRNVLAEAGSSTGARLFSAALAGGTQALDAPVSAIHPGSPADLVSLAHKDELSHCGDQTLDRWMFSNAIRVDDVWAAGVHLVQDGHHIGRTAIENTYKKTLQSLISD